MNTKTTAILASTLLTALFASQSAIAGQDSDEGVFAELTANTVTVTTDKVRYEAPTFDAADTVVSGRK